MKFLGKISILLLSAVIFMSAFVVFAEENTNTPPSWPYLQFSINVSHSNRLVETDPNIFSQKSSDAACAPFFALARDFPDLTMWITGISYATAYTKFTTGTRIEYKLTGYEYTLKGNASYGDPNGMLDEVNDAVNSFTPSGDTVYDKLVSIHDFICETNTYVSEEEGGLYCFSAYGALVDKKSVCEGYSEAFKLLCDKAGIDCIIVTGLSFSDTDGSSGTHMWNLVRMDDGEWYAVDATWDDAGDVPGCYNYFLVGSDTVIRNKSFSESHILSYDFTEIGGSSKTISNLEYPTLSSVAYDTENGKSDYTYGGERFHYNFLDDLQKEIYDKILSELLSNMPSDPTKHPNYETTDGNITTPSETTTVSDNTSSTDTVEVTNTTELETTEIVETTTVENTTEIPNETTTDADLITTTPDTTPPPESSTEKQTEPPKSSVTTKNPDTTASSTVADTTVTPDTTVNITTAVQTQARQDKEIYRLYETVTAVVVFCAISSLSLILIVAVFKFAKKYK